jgi:hypothetical protein
MTVNQAYPLDITREIDRRWQRRSKVVPSPRPNNDNHAGGGRCPACNVPASIAPTASEYRGQGFIHHHWMCHSCGHEWITVHQVLT